MEPSPKIIFNDLKPHIAKAIKESSPAGDAVIYKIADEVENIKTVGVEPGVEIAEGLSTIIDKTIKDAVDLRGDLSVIVKGILIGAFRSSPFMRLEAHKTIRILIEETLQSVVKSKGDIKQAVKGLLAAIVIISQEFKLNAPESLLVAKENILLVAKAISPKIVEDIIVILRESKDL